jgi:hypothetical protein
MGRHNRNHLIVYCWSHCIVMSIVDCVVLVSKKETKYDPQMVTLWKFNKHSFSSFSLVPLIVSSSILLSKLFLFCFFLFSLTHNIHHY